MKSFLLREKIPITKWGLIPDGVMYKGDIPEGYNLAIVPGPEYIILDVDRHNGKDGFKHIPFEILQELEETFNYTTKNNGKHYWLKYTGNKKLGNKTSGKSSDLRTEKGYVAYWHNEPIEQCLHRIRRTSPQLNEWLEGLFCYTVKGKFKIKNNDNSK